MMSGRAAHQEDIIPIQAHLDCTHVVANHTRIEGLVCSSNFNRPNTLLEERKETISASLHFQALEWQRKKSAEAFNES